MSPTLMDSLGSYPTVGTLQRWFPITHTHTPSYCQCLRAVRANLSSCQRRKNLDNQANYREVNTPSRM